MGRLESDLQRIKELAAKEQIIHRKISDKKEDVEYLSSFRIRDILPEGYEDLFTINFDDPDMELCVRSFARTKSQYGTLPSIKKIENEDIGTFLPWLYMDGPYTFELGGRQKKEIMKTFVKELLIIYGVSESVLEEISSKGW